MAAGRLVCWYVWCLFRDILKQPVELRGVIIPGNWANVGLRCHHLSIKMGFLIPEWGAPMGPRMFYPPDSGGRTRTSEFQGPPVIFEHWGKNVLVQTF